jgi:protein-L-isoaspartate O-methyltransferase
MVMSCRDLNSLESLYRYFPTRSWERARWRELAQQAVLQLAEQGHYGLPALLPSFVHARVAAALAASGLIGRSSLRAMAILTLGAHAGLEVRILKDLGAGTVLGVERDPRLVAVGHQVGLADPASLVVGDSWEYLAESQSNWDRILVLAPQRLALRPLWDQAQRRLTGSGCLVVLAHRGEAFDLPPQAYPCPALEDTMLAWVFRR